MINKLDDAITAPKTYWAIVDHLLHNKMPSAIPPLLVHGNFVLDFNKKANLYNNFLALICTTLKNASSLPYL